jgi:DNA repair exonuclease SbcCD ATPase subunit
MNWEAEDKEVHQIEVDLERLEKTAEEEERALAEARCRQQAAIEAQQILQHLAQATQQHVHNQIARIVSSCLSSVFDNPYEFCIQFERKRGRTEAQLRFRRQGLDMDPLTSSGGGVVDVAAFALRLACLLLHRPRLRKLLVLDEPFRFVSAEYRPRIRAMLEALATDTGVQILMVTHDEAYTVGKVLLLD